MIRRMTIDHDQFLSALQYHLPGHRADADEIFGKNAFREGILFHNLTPSVLTQSLHPLVESGGCPSEYAIIVGTSGAAGERVVVVTVRARSLPARTCGIAGGMPQKNINTCPPMRSGITCPAPLYGTCTMSIFSIVFSSSPERCCTLPMPGEAKVSCAGRALASAISSFTDFTGSEGWTTRTSGVIE